jgi:hypothetical protein
MFAIITDISPNFGTILHLVDSEELIDLFDDISCRDEIIVAPRGVEVGQRIRIIDAEFIADPVAQAW